MFNKKQSDIIILGAGPVGLIAAHALSDRNIKYDLLDQAPRPHTHSYALSLHPETMALMEQMGLAAEILKHARRIPSIGLYAGAQRKATLDYTKLDSSFPFLTVIGQAELEKILTSSLHKKGHKTKWSHRARYIEADKAGLKVTVDRLTMGMTGYAVAHIESQIDKVLQYQANYLIGADGYQSSARRCAGIKFDEIARPKHYAMFEFQTQAQLPDEMRLIISQGKTHVFWPMQHGFCRWSFELSEPATLPITNKPNQQLAPTTATELTLDQDHLEALLTEHAPWFKGNIENIPWRMIVKFEGRLANSFGHDRIWLAGDAAHISPPAGILSMNVGMHEAYDLAQRLATGTNDTTRQAALASYNDQRQQEWKQLLDLDHRRKKSNGRDTWWRENNETLVGNIPASGDSLLALLAQIDINLAA